MSLNAKSVLVATSNAQHLHDRRNMRLLAAVRNHTEQSSVLSMLFCCRVVGLGVDHAVPMAYLTGINTDVDPETGGSNAQSMYTKLVVDADDGMKQSMSDLPISQA